MLKNNLHRLLSVIFQSGFTTGKIDKIPKIKIKFNPLWSLNEVEQVSVEYQRAQAQQLRAQAARIYVDMDVLTPLEIRKKLSDSNGFDVEEVVDSDTIHQFESATRIDRCDYSIDQWTEKIGKRFDFETLRSNRNRILRWIQLRGVVICTEEDECEKAKRYILPVARVFPEYFLSLSALYVYRMDEQPEEFGSADAICWDDVTTDGNGTLHAIGISVEALDQGPEYTALCFIHELCHLIESKHNRKFHDCLNELIRRYNLETGSNIVNDNAGMEFRCDLQII